MSFDIPASTVTGLIGPNGAGKSTLVNLIAGLTKLSEGRILLDGERIETLEPHQVARRRIARTFQNIRLVGEASVRDNVALGALGVRELPLAGSILGLGKAAAAVREAAATADALIARFDMQAHADLPAAQLSYGHQRRVEIMRALAAGPRVLLLDEPAAGMNDIEAELLGSQIAALARQDIAILLIEHNMPFVMALCSRVYVLAAGELICSGAPEQVRRDPRVNRCLPRS